MKCQLYMKKLYFLEVAKWLAFTHVIKNTGMDLKKNTDINMSRTSYTLSALVNEKLHDIMSAKCRRNSQSLAAAQSSLKQYDQNFMSVL